MVTEMLRKVSASISSQRYIMQYQTINRQVTVPLTLLIYFDIFVMLHNVITIMGFPLSISDLLLHKYEAI